VPPEQCPYSNRCNKYLDFARRIDRLEERLDAKTRQCERLEAEVAQLKAAQAGGEAEAPAAAPPPFGSSTPSSKIPVKPNSTEENRAKVGGRPKGHAGCGRKAVQAEDADERVVLPLPVCPATHRTLTDVCAVTTRTVVHAVRAHSVTRHYTRYRCWCPTCGRFHESEVPGVMPRFMFSNDLLAQVLVDHYVHGIPLGTLARRLGVRKSALRRMAHRVADLLKAGVVPLRDEFLAAPVKHADETTWSCDGRRGYAWGFFTPTVSLYRFRETRGKAVPEELFGEGPHRGVLVVDRYAAYGGTWKGKIQYCLEHYKRNVRDLLDASPGNAEYQKYIPRFLELLAKAMRLRIRYKGREKDYCAESRKLRDEILALVKSPVKDGALKGYFDYMAGTSHRFFQWVDHPEVEAENNLAERGIRSLVIARKVSFGSQSVKGLTTRETLMSVVGTLRLRCDDPAAKLSRVFDALARDRNADVARLLWGDAKP
jgi:transposase